MFGAGREVTDRRQSLAEPRSSAGSPSPLLPVGIRRAGAAVRRGRRHVDSLGPHPLRHRRLGPARLSLCLGPDQAASVVLLSPASLSSGWLRSRALASATSSSTVT